MRMKGIRRCCWIGCCAVGLAVAGAGCGSVRWWGDADGVRISTVLVAAEEAGARLEFFSETGEPMASKMPGRPGSVSVHCPEGSGQDNYAYDEKGRVTRHMRSYGEDYAAGEWRDVQ